jgi:hypothetical protein
MNDIKLRINKEINDFYEWNMMWPNELWVGLKEKLELENYFNSGPIFYANGPISIDKKTTLKIDGLKIRLREKDNYFRVEYNPHY